ncbi:MAG: lamin tail domain-containing protein [Thermanaerothrix sp.]|nr:lamin tail domain-containing protein [Thermanaerothrix sp.]
MIFRYAKVSHVLLVSILLTASIGAGLVSAQTPNWARVVFIDVGQGDSIWIHGEDQYDVLIDGGPLSAGPTVVAHLQNQGIDDIDLLIISHGDADHIGGLIPILRSTYTIEAVADNGLPCTTATCQTLTAEIAKRGLTPTPLVAGQTINAGAAYLHILNPQPITKGKDNDDSVAIRAVHGQIAFLLTGDISTTAEATLMANGFPLQAQVLKVAHHGSKYSTGENFLATVQPTTAVISVGQNSYGHPAPETLDRLATSGVQVLRTDRMGTIVLYSDGSVFWMAQTANVVFLPLILRDFPSLPPPTPTLAPSPAQIRITYINYDPPGDDVQNEYIEIQNLGGSAQSLTGWTLSDQANNTYTFPNFSIGGNQTVRVWTKAGSNDSKNLYWGRDQAVWNNEGDCAYLKDNNGTSVSTYCYP